jgi:hypothetical protein
MMQTSRHFAALATMLLSLAVGSLPAGAKMVDTSPHFTVESYWSNHAIYLARITDVKSPTAPDNSYVTSYDVTKVISGASKSSNGTIHSNPGEELMDGLGGDQPLNFPEGVFIGSEMLLCEDTRYHQLTVARVMRYPEDQPLVLLLEKIAKLRATPSLRSLLDGANSEFDLMSEYCVNRLLTLPDQTISSDDLKRLQSLADDPARPGDYRITAERDALKFSGTPESGRDEAEYAWLRGVIETERHSRNSITDSHGYFDRLRPMIYQFLGLPKMQTDAADYVLDVIADSHAPPALRTAAGSALSGWDQNIFDFVNPDQRFVRMFKIGLALMRDPDPDVRISGVGMVFDRTLTIMATRSPGSVTDDYSGRAVRAVQAAIAVEKDSRVMSFFQSRLEFLNMKQTNPQLWKQMHDLETGSHGTNSR